MFEWHDLNSRHIATFIWLSLSIVFCVVKSSEVRHSIGDLIRAFLSPCIFISTFGLLLVATLAATLVVVLGRNVGLWETLPIVSTIVWSFTSGLVLLMNIAKNDKKFRSEACSTLAPATVTTEVLSNAIFPLWIELIAMPFVVFAYSLYMLESQDNKRVYQWVLSIYGLALLTMFIFGLIKDPDSCESAAQSVIFPLIMTIGVLPYLKSLILFERCRFKSGVKNKKVTASEYGDDWPLTVSEAKLCCKHDAVWVEVDGKRYGLNGWTKEFLKQHGIPSQELDPILRDHPELTETFTKLGEDGESFVSKMSTRRLLKEGRTLCETEK